MSEAEKIAAGLTEAQRAAARQTETWSGDICLSPTLLALNGLGLVVHVTNRDRTRIAALLTPLGLEVREILTRSRPDGNQ